MMERLKSWLKDRFSDADQASPADLHSTGAHTPPQKRPKAEAQQSTSDDVVIDPSVHGKIESRGPGKNVLIRNKYLREETGTHETLKILDDSMVDSGEETGIDPYNTGGFDRSKKWDQRFRK